MKKTHISLERVHFKISIEEIKDTICAYSISVLLYIFMEYYIVYLFY